MSCGSSWLKMGRLDIYVCVLMLSINFIGQVYQVSLQVRELISVALRHFLEKRSSHVWFQQVKIQLQEVQTCELFRQIISEINYATNTQSASILINLAKMLHRYVLASIWKMKWFLVVKILLKFSRGKCYHQTLANKFIFSKWKNQRQDEREIKTDLKQTGQA